MVGLMESQQNLLSVVVPVYNEAEVLPDFQLRLAKVLNQLRLSTEILYVDDGSNDGSSETLRALRSADSRVGIVTLSRNFGKEIALTAGLEHASGDCVVVIDADLQDPPEVITELVQFWREGFDVVYAKRRKRAGESWLKRVTASAFYRLMQHVGDVKIPEDVGDFRLLSRRAVDAVLRLREHHRFMKGLFSWIGYRQKAVLYDREPRHGGQTKWNYWKLWNFALEGITSFTVTPLKMASYVGALTACGAFIYGAVIIAKTILFGRDVPGYPSLMVVILFLGGIQLIALGVMGEYLGRIFNESKGRPLYYLDSYMPSTVSAVKSGPRGAQETARGAVVRR